MESLDHAACFMDELLTLDFVSDIGEEDDEEEKPRKAALPSPNPNGLNVLGPDDPGRPFPYAQEVAEEELEWLSNKDAFPAVETFVGIISDHPVSLVKQQSPVSVLENSTTSSNSNSNSNSTNGSTIMSCCGNLRVPVRARSKRRRKRCRDLSARESWWGQENVRNVKQAVSAATAAAAAAVIGRKCLHCGAEKTPQWRAGPMGPKTLCNACGVRYKSGRLVPEYRPASSPTFSSKLHSNSHRKIVEMRKQKQVMGMVVVKPMDKG